MPPSLHTRVVFHSPTVTIRDHRCRPTSATSGQDEYAPECCVVFPHSGVFVKHVNGRRILADPNGVLFFRTGETFRVSHPVPGGDDCLEVIPRPDVLRDMIGEIAPALADQPGSPLPANGGGSEPHEYLYQRRILARLVHAAAHEPIGVEETMLSLLERVLRGSIFGSGITPKTHRGGTFRAHRQIADAVRTILAARMTAKVTLDDLALAVHVSPFHLARVFREQTGIPVHRYQNRLRLRASLEPLADGRGALTAIALDLGYSSHSHFTDAFRAEFGISPSAFRQSATTNSLRQMSKIPEA